MLKARATTGGFSLQMPPPINREFYETSRGKALDFLFKLAIVAGVAACIIFAVQTRAFSRPWIILEDGQYFLFVMYAFVSYALVTSLYLVFKTCLWIVYKPVPPVYKGLPRVTVIIPAYNEGALVEKTIRSAVESGYPLRLLDVICVDDGSKDDTYHYMEKARAAYPGSVKLIRLPRNMGKRHALYNGLVQARGDIVATIDSDSIIENGALHHLVAPFLRDRNIGAVAGNVKVLNKHQGLIPKMLAVSFVFSFDFTRACQSTYGAVLCCPGAFSAYRVDIVREVMDAWLNQRFLGRNCTYGEDRALTNMILRKGFYSVYQSTARVLTAVPTTYGKLAKMFLRWERSNIRETIILGTFILKKYRQRDRFFPFLEFLMKNLRYPVQYYAIGFFFFNLLTEPVNVFRYLSVVGLLGVIYSFFYVRSEKNSDFVYGIFYCYFSILLLQWIFPYAFLTLKSRSWLTR